MFGISGSIVKRDAQCVLARNMLTGRIYTLHFVIFSVTAVIAVLSFSLRILVFLTPKLREIYVIKKMTKPEGRKDDIRYIMRFCDFGDWFFLLQLTCTMSNFDIWLSETKDQLQEREKELLWREMNPEEE
ncbi:hypothetical protein Avbf_04472 [Armadillidium vulgare]|nr:hypothetical protein Avbf_04472 [Armadillidium vulgare]